MFFILLLAAALRLAWLDLKAPHFDEGINGWFTDQMRVQGTFKYNADNYHGPWHFYVLFLSQSLLGRNLWALRLPSVVASLLMIPALFLFARWFGRTAVRWAALAFAVSPACVFYGRYSIHEAWFALACALFTWGIFALWLERDRAGLWVMIAGLTGMLLNKETYLIHTGSLLAAALVMAGWNRLSPLRPPPQRATARAWTVRDVWLGCLTSIFLLVFFYSGNFFNWPGLLGPFQSILEWTKTGTAGNGHEKGAYDLLPFVNYYWVALLARYEWPALAGLIWSVRYAWPSAAVPRLLAIYTTGILLAYSLVPYKTPWCIVSIMWPWFLFFGLAITAAGKVPARIAGALLLTVSLGMTLKLNFRDFEDDRELYVYVQAYRSLGRFTSPLLELAAADPRYFSTPIAIYLDSYYPVPWILGDFYSVGYHGPKIPDPLPEASVHVVETEKAADLRAKLGDKFEERHFNFRSGMDQCSVFFSRELLSQWMQLRPNAAPRRGEP
ncbi:MAG: glycosyltransferase family 39 protein [Chthoniobacterales bacterium]|jgi:uncharacterized protein (TIGR03663 family)